MNEHIVTQGQNIFDVALQLYGSIEGLFDLLISNPSLSMCTSLNAGDKLYYHDYFTINQNIVENLPDTVANGERGVYHKASSFNLLAIVKIDKEEHMSSFAVSGKGNMVIDWGDNSLLESKALTNVRTSLVHYYSNQHSPKTIKIYGNCQLTLLDVTGINGVVYTTREIVVDEYDNYENKGALEGLLLFKDTYRVGLGGHISSLLPVGELHLQELDLTRCSFESSDVIDSYLEYIVANYGTRRPCTVKLSATPGAKGMAAIDTILNEESWNASSSWVFIINDNIITTNG